MDPFTIGLAVSALGSVAGGIMGSQSAKKQQKAIEEQQRRAMAFIQQGMERAESAQLKGISSIQSGYADALKSVGGMGQTAQARLLQRERSMMGASDAAMMSRGLYSSTQALGQRRAIADQTNLGLAQIDEAAAGMYSNLFASRGQAIGSAYSNLASLYSQMYGQMSQVEMANQHVQANAGEAVAGMTGELTKMFMMKSMMDHGFNPSQMYGPYQANGTF
jgi:hypothetical protein